MIGATQNLEGYHDYDIPGFAPRPRGLSAMLRVKNEETWIVPCLESLFPFCDEVVVVLNACTDRTPELVARYADRVTIYEYPFAIHPMGPGHDACPNESVHASAYFYRYALSKTTRSHVLKWDGDMVAMDGLGEKLRTLMQQGHDRIKLWGTDLVGENFRHVGAQDRTPTDGVVKVTPETTWIQGPLTQTFRCPLPITATVREAFLHFKWAKPFASAVVQWPENWREIPHFQRIAQRRHPVAPYTGAYPKSISHLLGVAA